MIEVRASAKHLLGMPAARFLREYWQKRPLLVRGAFPDFADPLTPDDLAGHVCLQLLLGDNTAYRWDLGSGETARRLRVPGLITLNDTATTIIAAKAGLGLAYVLEARIAEEVAEGSLEVVLDDQASDGDPFHMYYSSRRHNHPALRTLINIIRLQNGMTRLA